MSNKNRSLRKRATRCGLTMQVVGNSYRFFDAGTLVFGPAPFADAEAFLARMSPGRGRPKAAAKLGPHDWRKAHKYGYVLRAEDGVIRMWNGAELILETSDVCRVRRYFANAAERLVSWGPAAIEREAAAMRKIAEREARVEARRLAGLARKAERRAKRTRGGLAVDDPGVESADMTPADARGLVLTALKLPVGVDGDAALIALWVAENLNTSKAAPAVSAKIDAAREALAKETRGVEVWLSGHDRASLARYPAPAGVVLTAAAMAMQAGKRPRVRSI